MHLKTTSSEMRTAPEGSCLLSLDRLPPIPFGTRNDDACNALTRLNVDAKCGHTRALVRHLTRQRSASSTRDQCTTRRPPSRSPRRCPHHSATASETSRTGGPNPAPDAEPYESTEPDKPAESYEPTQFEEPNKVLRADSIWSAQRHNLGSPSPLRLCHSTFS
jgi:hypothetical protein